MNVRQLARLAPQVNKLSSRTITRSVIVNKAAHDSHAAHGDDHHDDHHHHAHPMWENLPFNKYTIGLLVFGGSFAGVSLIVSACAFQNKKHGFSK